MLQGVRVQIPSRVPNELDCMTTFGRYASSTVTQTAQRLSEHAILKKNNSNGTYRILFTNIPVVLSVRTNKGYSTVSAWIMNAMGVGF